MSRATKLRLLGIAANLEAEAQTWADGFAVCREGSWEFGKEYEWAHVHWFKLLRDAAILRELAKAP